MRLFIALPLTDEARRGVRQAVKILQRGRWPIRWEPEEKWHVTLAFFGSENSENSVIRKVRQSEIQKTKPFELKFKGLGAFPDLAGGQSGCLW